MGSAEGVRAILCPRVKSSQVSEATHSHSELFDPNVSSPGSWEEELVGQVKSSQVKSSRGATHSHSELTDPNVSPPWCRGL